nr:hypothetical protein [Tanacetum cinerariifolium]
MKVIEEGSKKLRLVKNDDDSFTFNSPHGITFNEFNRLSGMDDDSFTYTVEIPRLHTILGNTIVLEEPWSENEIPIDDIHHICEPIRFKNGKAKWLPCNLNMEGFCNQGELSRMIRVGYMTYFQDFKWYDDLVDGKLKKEALKQKSRYERS